MNKKYKRGKLFMERLKAFIKSDSFFSSTLSRLLLWPLLDVLINNLQNVKWKFFSYYNSSLFTVVCEAAKSWRKTSIQFYEFMTGTLNKRWSWREKKKRKKKLVNEIYFVRDFKSRRRLEVRFHLFTKSNIHNYAN